MADARTMPEEPSSPTHLPTFLKDYREPDFWIRHVDLTFDLAPGKTEVTSILTVERNGTHDRPLKLAGDDIKATRVAVDGKDVDIVMDDAMLIVPVAGKTAEVMTQVTLDPAANSQLMGLYASGGMLCTQCESEGFRRITFHPDRPDVLSTYRVKMIADKAAFPVLLSNGNEVETGDAGAGRHYAVWEDPHPKPSYLFALVAGDLSANRDRFTTMTGRTVDLAIWVRERDLPRTAHAMQALKDSMKWDEETYGREYDLDLFNIVAVDDFNFGAMENKGLNIFNSRYILADSDTATDTDFDNIAGVVAHEYFHNWSGNRVTCRDWFQLSLKEGFTVFRDQCFSQDMGSFAVKRIDDVRILRAVQFPEDSGPLAHPVRPESFIEIANFYTATVYNKGAELIRMMHTILGADDFRKGSDLYFERHDGEAVTCEDFVAAMEQASGQDLGQFRLWYSQAGTPDVSAQLVQSDGKATLTLRQSMRDVTGDSAMAIPLKIGLVSADTGQDVASRLVLLTEAEQTEAFDVDGPVLLSINRDFSAPVNLDVTRADGELEALAARDPNPFARYEAMQDLMGKALRDAIAGAQIAAEPVVEAVRLTLADDALDPAFKAAAIRLPSESVLAEQLDEVDPDAVHDAREQLAATIGAALESELRDALVTDAKGDDLSGRAKGARALRGQALDYIAKGNASLGSSLAKAQYDDADNMTDRQSALRVLSDLDAPERAEAFDHFYEKYQDDTLVLDKWFMLQALSQRAEALDEIEALLDHPRFTMKNPNRLRALVSSFTANQWLFNHASGRGYALLAKLVIEADSLNPQVAARLVPPLGRWRKFASPQREQMQDGLREILKAKGLSRDVYEQASKSLGV